MAHRFDLTHADPYVAGAHAVEENVFSGKGGLGGGANEEVFDRLSNAIVSAVGDVLAEAFRLGVNEPNQIRGLARAIGAASAAIAQSYQGEVDPEPALRAIEQDSRFSTLPDVPREDLQREIEKTRQVETLLLTARRLPDLLDYAGSLGMHMPDDLLANATLLVGQGPTPSPQAQGKELGG